MELVAKGHGLESGDWRLETGEEHGSRQDIGTGFDRQACIGLAMASRKAVWQSWTWTCGYETCGHGLVEATSDTDTAKGI